MYNDIYLCNTLLSFAFDISLLKYCSLLFSTQAKITESRPEESSNQVVIIDKATEIRSRSSARDSPSSSNARRGRRRRRHSHTSPSSSSDARSMRSENSNRNPAAKRTRKTQNNFSESSSSLDQIKEMLSMVANSVSSYEQKLKQHENLNNPQTREHARHISDSSEAASSPGRRDINPLLQENCSSDSEDEELVATTQYQTVISKSNSTVEDPNNNQVMNTEDVSDLIVFHQEPIETVNSVVREPTDTRNTDNFNLTPSNSPPSDSEDRVEYFVPEEVSLETTLYLPQSARMHYYDNDRATIDYKGSSVSYVLPVEEENKSFRFRADAQIRNHHDLIIDCTKKPRSQGKKPISDASHFTIIRSLLLHKQTEKAACLATPNTCDGKRCLPFTSDLAGEECLIQEADRVIKEMDATFTKVPNTSSPRGNPTLKITTKGKISSYLSTDPCLQKLEGVEDIQSALDTPDKHFVDNDMKTRSELRKQLELHHMIDAIGALLKNATDWVRMENAQQVLHDLGQLHHFIELIKSCILPDIRMATNNAVKARLNLRMNMSKRIGEGVIRQKLLPSDIFVPQIFPLKVAKEASEILRTLPMHAQAEAIAPKKPDPTKRVYSKTILLPPVRKSRVENYKASSNKDVQRRRSLSAPSGSFKSAKKYPDSKRQYSQGSSSLDRVHFRSRNASERGRGTSNTRFDDRVFPRAKSNHLPSSVRGRGSGYRL